MFGFLVLWFIIGFVVVGYDVLNDIRLGMDWRLLLLIGHILLFFVSRAPLCNVVYCNGVQTLVNSGG